jgi:hypothetical protein
MCAGRATVHERRMGNHNPAQPPRTGAEKMKKIGDISKYGWPTTYLNSASIYWAQYENTLARNVPYDSYTLRRVAYVATNSSRSPRVLREGRATYLAGTINQAAHLSAGP